MRVDVIPSFFHGLAYRCQWTGGQRDVLKTVALVLMVIDHINHVLSLHNEAMMWLGRGAFPLFGLVWGYNLTRHKHIRQSSINALWCWAMIAQPTYMSAGFPWWQGNILFTFAVAGQVLRWFELESGIKWKVASIGLILVWLPFSLTSYDFTGIVMLVSCRYLFVPMEIMERQFFTLLWGLSVLMLNVDVSWEASISGLLLTLLAILGCQRWGRQKRFWPPHFFVVIYTVHLALLGCLANVM